MDSEKNTSALASANLDVDSLTEYAKEFGFEMEPIVYGSSENSSYKKKTYKTFLEFTPEEAEVRVLKPSWMEGNESGAFVWEKQDEPGFTDDELEEFSGINQLGGYVLYSEIQAQRNVYNAESNSFDRDRSCSSVGYYSKIHDAYVKGLPSTVPLKRMTGYDNKNKVYDPKLPDPLVSGHQLLGSRGSTCETCIRAGLSQVELPDGTIKRCEPRGRMFFYLTHVSRVKKQRPNSEGVITYSTTTKTVQELYGKPGLLLMINLPAKSGLVGHFEYGNPENSIAGYSAYLLSLQWEAKNQKNPALAIPFIHYTTITIKQSPKAGGSPKNLLHFKREPVGDKQLLDKAQALWKSIYNPQVELLNIEDYQGLEVLSGEQAPDESFEHVIPVSRSTQVETVSNNSPMKSAVPMDDIPF